MHKRPKLVDLDRAFSGVKPEVQAAALAAHEVLNEKGVPHVLVGGLAVGAHGYPYATQDVDFLVGKEAFEFSTRGLISFAPGIPIQVNGVQIDYLDPDPNARLDEVVERARGVEALTVVPIEGLVYMKLLAGRQKDQAAIVELVHAGCDVDFIAAFLGEVAPDLLQRFERLVAKARAEEE